MDALYQTFLCVVEEMSISRAAARLHTTQPTVTRQIQQLERTLSTTLFDRSGKRLFLTAAGLRVHEYVRQLAATEARMRDELEELLHPGMGVVRLGAGVSPTMFRLPSVIAAYRVEHPNVRFQVVTGSSKWTTQRLLNRDIDLAIVTTLPDEMRQVRAIPLWHDALCVVAAKTHPFAKGMMTVAELAKQPMVVMHAESGLRQLLTQTLRQADAAEPLRPVLETDSLEAMNRFVQAGIGVAIMPWSAVRDDVHAKRLSTIQLTDIDLGARTITVLLRSVGGLPAAATAFVDALQMYAKTSSL